MQPLTTEFKFAGHWLRQVWRQADVAVFERGFPGRSAHELELVIVRDKSEATLPSGSVLPEHEAYPSSSEWGTLGWSFPIRYLDMVLDLAKKLLGISNARGQFVRSAISNFKRTVTM